MSILVHHRCLGIDLNLPWLCCALDFDATEIANCYSYVVLNRLASSICGYKCFQIELKRGYDYSTFHDDLKKMYTMAGVENQDTVFLFTDTQVNNRFEK